MSRCACPACPCKVTPKKGVRVCPFCMKGEHRPEPKKEEKWQ